MKFIDIHKLQEEINRNPLIKLYLILFIFLSFLFYSFVLYQNAVNYHYGPLDSESMTSTGLIMISGLAFILLNLVAIFLFLNRKYSFTLKIIPIGAFLIYIIGPFIPYESIIVIGIHFLLILYSLFLLFLLIFLNKDHLL